MRTTLLASAVAAALLLVGGTAALAQAPDDHVSRAEAAKARHDEMAAARAAILDGFHANRSAILDAYHASLNATRASFLENKSAVLERCGESRSNETAKCVTDGLKPLIEKARAEHKAARELALDKLREQRALGMAAWAKAFREANEHYRARTGDAAPGA